MALVPDASGNNARSPTSGFDGTDDHNPTVEEQLTITKADVTLTNVSNTDFAAKAAAAGVAAGTYLPASFANTTTDPNSAPNGHSSGTSSAVDGSSRLWHWYTFLRTGNSNGVQLAQAEAASGLFYMRRKTAGIWAAWQQIYTSATFNYALYALAAGQYFTGPFGLAGSGALSRLSFDSDVDRVYMRAGDVVGDDIGGKLRFTGWNNTDLVELQALIGGSARNLYHEGNFNLKRNVWVMRMTRLLHGGGIITLSTAATPELKWSARFVTIGAGYGGTTPSYFELLMPAAATVITAHGGGVNQTVTAGGIPMPAWYALYFIPNYGVNNSGEYRLVDITSAYDVPEDWILVAIRNGDDGTVRVSNGSVLGLRRNRDDLRVTTELNTPMAGATAIDCSLSNHFSKDITAAHAFTFTNPPPTGVVYSGILRMKNTSGGSLTPTWPGTVDWDISGAPAVPNNKIVEVGFKTLDGGGKWDMWKQLEVSAT